MCDAITFQILPILDGMCAGVACPHHLRRSLEAFFIIWSKNVLTPFLDLVIISQNSSGLAPPLPGLCHSFWAGGAPSRLAPPLLGWRHPHWARAIPSGLTPTLLGSQYPFWARATRSALEQPLLGSCSPFWACTPLLGSGDPFGLG